MTLNQNPEQKARDHIDTRLNQAGWVVQSARKIDLNAGLGQAVREYQTDAGPADYVLFVEKKAVGVIEAKREDLGHRITEVELQTAGYAAAKLKWINNTQPMPLLRALPMVVIPSRAHAKYSIFTGLKRLKHGSRKMPACASVCNTYRCSTRII